jgi:hypothetical protein
MKGIPRIEVAETVDASGVAFWWNCDRATELASLAKARRVWRSISL